MNHYHADLQGYVGNGKSAMRQLSTKSSLVSSGLKSSSTSVGVSSTSVGVKKKKVQYIEVLLVSDSARYAQFGKDARQMSLFDAQLILSAL